VSDPENPYEVGSFDTPRYAFDVEICGNLAYIAEGYEGLRIVDVNNPENIREVGICDPQGWICDVFISSGFAFLAGGSGGLRVVDVSNPENPYEVGNYATGWANGVAVSGDLVLLADTFGGLRVIDVSTPESPDEVGYYDTPGEANNVAVSGNFAFIADDWAGIWVVDFSDPENPSEVGYYDTPGGANQVAISGELIFVADWSSLGIYRYTGAETIEGSDDSIPDKFAVYPAYPNPFNSSTAIRFELSRPGLVRLDVHDQLGRKVSELATAIWFGSGTHTFSMNASDFPSGNYFVVLEAGNEVLATPIMLVK